MRQTPGDAQGTTGWTGARPPTQRARARATDARAALDAGAGRNRSPAARRRSARAEGPSPSTGGSELYKFSDRLCARVGDPRRRRPRLLSSPHLTPGASSRRSASLGDEPGAPRAPLRCCTVHGSDPLSSVPATRPRRIVTETDGVEKALDEAARRWPGLSRAQLLVRLALRGAEAGRREASRRRKARREVIGRARAAC